MSTTVAPLTPPPERVERLPFGARFPVVFAWGVRRALCGKKPYVTAALTLLMGIGLGLLQHGKPDRIAWNVWNVLDHALLAVAVPLVALALVGGGFGEEVEDQTLVFHLVRPVSRSTLYVGRYAAGLVPAMVLAAAMVVALPVTAGVALPASALLAIAGVGALAIATVGAVYYALAALFRRGLIIGLVYTFVVEGFFQFLPGSNQKLSLMHHVRSVYHRLTDDAFAALSARVADEVQRTADPHAPRRATDVVFSQAEREPWTSVSGALLLCAVVIALALVLGARAVSRKDYALKD